MKPCPKNLEKIALLAMDPSEIQHAPELRAHLDTCAGCRRYLEEISSVVGNIRASEPPSKAQPSPSFHRNVVAAVSATRRRSFIETLVEQALSGWNWRVALPIATAVVLLLAAWRTTLPHPGDPAPSRANGALATPSLDANLAPTFSNYEMAAHQSLDKLDELLTEQGNKNQPPSPVSAAALSSRLSAAD